MACLRHRGGTATIGLSASRTSQSPLETHGDGVGRHPLGDLTLVAPADTRGGYGRASTCLDEQLGIGGAVLPATVEPARRHIKAVEQLTTGEASGRLRIE